MAAVEERAILQSSNSSWQDNCLWTASAIFAIERSFVSSRYAGMTDLIFAATLTLSPDLQSPCLLVFTADDALCDIDC